MVAPDTNGLQSGLEKEEKDVTNLAARLGVGEQPAHSGARKQTDGALQHVESITARAHARGSRKDEWRAALKNGADKPNISDGDSCAKVCAAVAGRQGGSLWAGA